MDLEALRERAGVWAGVLLLVVGLGLVVVAVWLGRDVPLWLFGRRVEAEVVDVWMVQTGESGDEDFKEVYFDFFAEYQFTTEAGQVITRTAKLAVSEWSELGKGSRVAVIYSPSRPDRAQLDNRRFLPLFTVCYVPILLLTFALLAGGWNLLRPYLAALKR